MIIPIAWIERSCGGYPWLLLRWGSVAQGKVEWFLEVEADVDDHGLVVVMVLHVHADPTAAGSLSSRIKHVLQSP